MLLFLAVVALGLALGYARRGSIRNLGSARLRGIWIVLAAVALQAIAWRAVPRHLDLLAFGLVLFSYLLVLVFAVVNVRAPWMWIIGTGALLNLVVIVPNGGMPVSTEAAARLGHSVRETQDVLLRGKHTLETSSTVLPQLGDVIPVPGDQSVASVGDLFIWAGLVVLIQRLMLGARGAHAAPDYLDTDIGRVSTTTPEHPDNRDHLNRRETTPSRQG
jgi:uncharacterized protein DUF5317